MTSTRESTDAAAIPRMAARDVCVDFGPTRVLHEVSLDVMHGTTVGLVGESGSGKSTLANTIVGMVAPSSGTIEFDGVDAASLTRQKRATLRRRVQLIPQDPYSSLDPRRTIAQSLAEAIEPKRARVKRNRDRIAYMLELVKLDADTMHRYPHQFSGGQRQRIAIARALVIEPEIVIADEITSALDVSVQAEVLALIADLRRELALTMVFISHNLAVVRQVSDQVTVLLHGRVVEQADADDVFTAPRHSYTRQLLASVPGSPGFTLA